MILTIAPTLACNFGCDYCFQGADKPAGRMTDEVQDRLVAFVDHATASVRHLNVTWYGGEPLLAQGVIEALSKRLIRLCAERGVTYDATIVTNGYKLNAVTAAELVAQRITTCQITLDGAQQEHDSRRCLLGGQGSFERIVENMRGIVDTIPLHINVRINIDGRNAGGVYGLLDHLAQQGFARRRGFGVYFAPVEAITEGCHNVVGDCMTKTAYGVLEADLSRRAFDLGLASLPYPPRFRGVCGALRPQGWVVVPNGDIHKCWDTVSFPEHRVGSVFDVAALSGDDRVRRWDEWTPFEHPICSTCKLLPNCAGNCAHKFLNPEQTLGEAAVLPCPSWKYNVNERLVLMAEKRGAINPDDYDPAEIVTDSLAICPTPHPLDPKRRAGGARTVRRRLEVVA